MHVSYVVMCRRVKGDPKRTLFTICPKAREKQCENNHFDVANNLLNPKVSRKGTSNTYPHVYTHIISEV